MNLPLEAKDVKGFVHDLHLLDIVDGVHLDLAQAAGRIVCAKGGRQIVQQSQSSNKVRLSNTSRLEINISESHKVKSSNKVRLSNKFFTVDVVTQLAGLVQVDDMGDEEVEHVVTSLASLTIKIKTWLLTLKF